jgi:disulfide bond formation protein DsbB
MEEIFIKILSLGALLISVLIISFLISFIFRSSSSYTKFLKKYGLQIIFIFSLVATLGSLALSVVFEQPPCDLCWYQRMFMYPIVFISGFAWYKKDFKNGAIYSIMLAVIGALVALYNYLLQISDTLKSSSTFCSPGSATDCSIPEFVEFGFVTTPYISLVAFLLIIISAYYASRKD